ncbi:hypothetical protein A1O3_01691 [Capronia epimyces CBS 606.96]|uniref:tRNA dimethylallyltransferase n=1 Tax=Capronia epimyces CBS 606.96 TaxID=1182542 RepID=W9ZF52_9EURO|nr:uncharacterized protein A1O3_01691 [Capronia epimyces CBS 606.96]EXJ93134.1 hypothetical protein A1O3_01691 [Capronia epimyces CBS 606.96]
MASHAPKDPLIVVIGATGTGKSKLAVQLAARFNGEIVNGDAMQMYKGLPIITNKMPEHERNGIPHHLLDFIGLDENPWTVNQFVKESSRIIDEIRSRGKLPIVVGGTHYYTHALLFKDATLAEGGAGSGLEKADIPGPNQPCSILSKSTEEILAQLQEVDPEIARRWHPRDRRKIQRSLEIWLKTGRKASDVYAEQQERRSGGHDGADLDSPQHADRNGLVADEHGFRYSTLLLWLEAEDTALKERLNARVESMVASGLVDEAASMAKLEADLQRKGIPVDKSKGIWVSIGYKEMESWIDCQQTSGVVSAENSRILQAAIGSVKAGTRRYAKRQNRYIRIRLANALARTGKLDKLFLLDCSDLAQWDSAVQTPASKIVGCFLNGEEPPDPRSLSDLANRMLPLPDEHETQPNRIARRCEICDKTLMTEAEWNGHLVSRGHKNTVVARRKRDLTATETIRRDVTFAKSLEG